MKTETMEEFIARGGKITKCAAGSNEFDYSAIYRKDKQLNALRSLKKQDGLSDKEMVEIEKAIFSRIQILKITF